MAEASQRMAEFRVKWCLNKQCLWEDHTDLETKHKPLLSTWILQRIQKKSTSNFSSVQNPMKYHCLKPGSSVSGKKSALNLQQNKILKFQKWLLLQLAPIPYPAGEAALGWYFYQAFLSKPLTGALGRSSVPINIFYSFFLVVFGAILPVLKGSWLTAPVLQVLHCWWLWAPSTWNATQSVQGPEKLGNLVVQLTESWRCTGIFTSDQ